MSYKPSNPNGQATMANSEPVVIASNQTAIPVTDNAGSLTVDGTVAATQSGTWNVTNISGTVSLPTGAATAANQTTANTSLSSIDGKLPALSSGLLPVLVDAGLSGLLSEGAFSAVFGSSNVKLAGQVDNLTNTVHSLMTSSFLYGFDGTNWDRLRGDSTDGLTVNLGANNDVTVTSLPALATGSNVIGAVTQSGTWNIGSITTLPALVAGTALIGKVGIDQTTPGTTNAVSLAQIGSTTVATGNGVVGTGVQRVAIASDNTAFSVNATLQAGTNGIGKLTSNSGVTIGAVEIAATQTLSTVTTVSTVTSLTQMNGQAIAMGTGVRSAGTQRVTIATDDVVPISDNSGSITVDAPLTTPVFATVTPNTTGGWTVFMASSADGSTALTNTAQAIKASAGTFGGYYIYNPNTSAVYVHIYNVASGSVTVGTTNPQCTFCIPASAGANLEITCGLNFSTAMSVAATTTGGGNTAPSTALEAVFFYK